MPIDFSALVLSPAMATFAKAVIVYPVAGNGVVGYPARGIFTSTPVDVVMQDGAIFSDTKTTLGIRLAEFQIPIVPRDRIEIDGTMYWVNDVDPDGQGGITVTLSSTAPSEYP